MLVAVPRHQCIKRFGGAPPLSPPNPAVVALNRSLSCRQEAAGIHVELVLVGAGLWRAPGPVPGHLETVSREGSRFHKT